MNKHLKIFYLILLTLVAACENIETKYSNNVISSPHPLATEAGRLMFQKGGNAFDAAVASAFTLSVVEPSMSGIGGRLQIIYKKSQSGIFGIDATTQIPENFVNEVDELPSFGYKTIGIPGVVAGLIKLHEENGILDLKTVMSPSINIASNGFTILPGEIERQKNEREKIMLFEGTKSYFLNSNEESFKIGDKLIQKDLANTLRAIANNGKKGFYEGEVAKQIAFDIQSNGGFITENDLKNYSAQKSEILTGKFNGYEVHAPNIPSYGQITIQMIQVFDHLSINSELDWVLKVSSAIEEVYKYRQYQNNLDSVSSMLSIERAKEIANKIENDIKYLPHENNIVKPDAVHMTQGHTAHLTTSDNNGNVVSLTQTLGPSMGSKVTTKGLGFLYNVTMGPYLGGYLGEDKPGNRVSSHISPTLFTKKNQVILALGAAGGNKIPIAINQVAYRFLKQKLPIGESLFLPRVYKDNSPIYVESHLGLTRFFNYDFQSGNYNVEKIKSEGYFGRVHAVVYDSINKSWVGSADPDWEGSVSYYK
tara:strand:- start:10160 stop:11767 length:1608 start_codon:yes stop_codon:yes gene_type:complete